jgi:uncharacterized RDD family membrane protein YckC
LTLVHDTLDGADREFAEWFVWAKREVSSDDRVCLGAAQAAVEAQAGGADRQAAQMVARRSVMGQGTIMSDRVAPRRRAYAEWYDWARREIGGDPGRLHSATEAALGCIERGGGADDAASAARSLVNGPPAGAPLPAPPAPPPSPAPPLPPAYQGWHAPTQGWQAPAATAPAVPPAPAWPVQPVRDETPYARFGERLIAFLVDAVVQLVGVLLIALVITIFFVAGVAGKSPAEASAAATGWLAAIGVFVVVLVWLYAAGLEYSAWQATIGKRAAGLVVTDRAGRRIGFGRATARHFAKSAPFLILVAGVLFGTFVIVIVLLALVAIAIEAVEVLLALVTSRKQALHDLIAGTQVVRREDPALT